VPRPNLDRDVLTQQLGRWPRSGDSVIVGDYTARVLSTQQKQARQVLLSPTPKKTEVVEEKK